jgi:hypothetical protein
LAQDEPLRRRVLGVWFAALTIMAVVLLILIFCIMALVFYRR